MMTPAGAIVLYSCYTTCSQASDAARRTPWPFSSTAKRSSDQGRFGRQWRLSSSSRGKRVTSRPEYCIATTTRKARIHPQQ